MTISHAYGLKLSENALKRIAYFPQILKWESIDPDQHLVTKGRYGAVRSAKNALINVEWL